MTSFFRKLRIAILILILFCASISVSPPIARKAYASGCSDIAFIFARGSGEQLGDVSFRAWKDENTKAIDRLNLGLTYYFYELGSEAQSGAQYPAVAVAGGLKGIGNLLGAFVSGGAAFDFGKSVEEGSTELLNYIEKVSSSCSETKFVLGGYSQGAMLISRVLNQINPDKVIYVATFGDPKLYLPEGEGNRPVACLGKQLSNYRAYVSDCHAYEGVLGSYRPYQPEGYYNKLGTYCNSKDIMCSSGMSISDHTSYTTRGLYQLAASTIAKRILSTFRFEADNSEALPQSTHDLLLVFDTTYGMHSNINNYIAKAKALIRSTRSLGGRVAIYTLWQQRVIWSHIKPVIYQVCDFTCEPEEVERIIDNLDDRLAPSSATTGNLPIYMTLNQAMQELEWQVGATKTAVVFASQPPKPIDYDGTTLEDVVRLSLEIDPVNIFAVTYNEQAATRFEAMTSATNGQVYYLPNQTSDIVDDIIGRPSVQLALETYSGVIGDELTFDVSVTDDGATSRIWHYDWDLDADGIFEIQNSISSVHQTYSAPLSGYVQVRVTDESGYSSTMSAKIDITEAPAVPAKITSLTATQIASQTFQINFLTNATKVLVILNDLPLGFIDPAQESSLTISDISQTSTLSLVPYSAAERRGEASSIILDSTSAILSPTPDNVPPTTTPSQTPTESDSALNSPSHLPLKGQQPSFPKAPNTGYFAG